MIERFAAETDVKLAISLNASDDETRDRIMPINKQVEHRRADRGRAASSRSKQGRRITFEYVLMEGVNDTDEDAERLVRAARAACR